MNKLSKLYSPTIHQLGLANQSTVKPKRFTHAIVLLTVCLIMLLIAGCTTAWWYPKHAKPISIDGKELVIMETTVGDFVTDEFEVIRTSRVQSYVGYQTALDDEGKLDPSFGVFVDPESYEVDPLVDEVVEETPGSGDAVYMLTREGHYYGIFSISLDEKAPLSEAVIASYAFEPLDNLSVELWPEIMWEGYDIRDITPEILESYTYSFFSLPPEDYAIMPHGPTPDNPRGASNGLRLGDIFWTDISFSREDPNLVRIFEVYMR